MIWGSKPEPESRRTMQKENNNVEVIVEIKVVQGEDWGYSKVTLAEATSSEKGNVEPGDIADLVARHVNRAHDLVDTRIRAAAAETLAQRARELAAKAEREARPDLT